MYYYLTKIETVWCCELLRAVGVNCYMVMMVSLKTATRGRCKLLHGVAVDWHTQAQ